MAPDKLQVLKKGRSLYTRASPQTLCPSFFRLKDQKDEAALARLLSESPSIHICDTIDSQLKELIKIRNPSHKFDSKSIAEAIHAHLAPYPAWAYGVWVYYPWNEKLVHILDEEEFIELRTNRNLYKITPEERIRLSTKKIGIIGLSVGQSVSLTLAMERSFGELRIADFDTLDLSNMNRLRTGLYNLGLPKTTIVAREIAEIDPFLKVTCFPEGITEHNIADFLQKGGPLDILIDECDSLDIKILCRQKARALRIPVLMDTSDRGIIDIERFDLEKNRAVLHGLVNDLDPEKLKKLTNEQKIPYILKMIDVDHLSSRSKVSLIEIGQSINTWPQLSSSVVIGGGATADVCRRILTDQLHISGRYYFDCEHSISDPEAGKRKKSVITNPYLPLTLEKMLKICTSQSQAINNSKLHEYQIHPDNRTITSIVEAAGKAPSSGNDQPWQWMYINGSLYLFHDIYRSYSFGDYKNIGSYESLGASIENLILGVHKEGIEASVQLFPDPNHPILIAKIQFYKDPLYLTEPHIEDKLYFSINTRCTNRKITPRVPLEERIYKQLKDIVETVQGASVSFITEIEQLKEISKIISSIDRLRIIHPHGHYDFFHREMRWTKEEVVTKRDGMDIETLEIPKSALPALKIVADDDVINMIRDIDGGQLFKSVSIDNVTAASAMGFLTIEEHSPTGYINGGRALQRLWLKATQLNVALHPLIAPLYLFPRILYGEGEGLTDNMIKELYLLRKRFEKIFNCSEKRNEIFLFRIFPDSPVKTRSLRRKIDDILTIID